MRLSNTLAFRASLVRLRTLKRSPWGQWTEKNILGQDTGARAPNQELVGGRLFQDPLQGYWETHGKMEFKSGDDYRISEEEKQAVLDRYRTKEILKKEYLRREFDPYHFRYKEGVVMDPAMFRWYAAQMTEIEQFRYTPKTALIMMGYIVFMMYGWIRLMFIEHDSNSRDCLSGKTLWWDRENKRLYSTSGHDFQAPTMVTVWQDTP